MKAVLIHTLLFLLVSANVIGQINFRNEVIQVPNATTTMNAVEIGDVSNDGLNDIVTGSVSCSNLFFVLYVVVYNQKSDGTLAAPFTLNYSNANQPLQDIEIADVNNDHLNDIILGFGSSIGIYYQLGGGGFSDLRTLSSINPSHGIKTGDLNDDGLIDILGFENSSFKIFYQTPTGDFNLTSIPVRQTNYTQIQIGDLNGDGLKDIANTWGSGIEIFYQKKGIGITKTDSLFISNINTDSYMTTLSGFTFADLNNDGRQDIATAYGGNTGRMKLFYQTADGKIDTLHAKSYAAYDIPTPIRVSDLNCDGDNEIIIGNHAWEKISIYNKYNLADYGGYTLHPSSYYFTPFSLAVGDINGDFLPDILNVNQNAKIDILYNTSKPLVFDSYEREVVNLQIKRDTTIRDTVIYSAISDTSIYCKRNNFRKFQIHQIWNNEHYSGDSLLIRHATMCTVYTDTIKSTYSFSKSFILQCDTIQSIENRDVLAVDLESATFSSKLNYTYASISSNICWKISVDQDWLKSSATSGSNEGSGKIYHHYVEFQISPNPTLNERTATITITGDGVPSHSITIVQEGAAPEVNTSASSIIVCDEVFNSAHLLIWSTVNWEISSDVDWLTVDKTQGTPSINNYEIITIQASPNTTYTEKNAVITITGAPDIVKKISIRQMKKGFNTEERTNDAGIRVYPNPVKDMLLIETDPAIVISHIRISDLRGMILYESNPNAHLNEVDFSRLPKGIYLLKMDMGSSIVVRKIIKQ